MKKATYSCDGSFFDVGIGPRGWAVQATIALLNSSADNEPTKDWIRIRVSALHGKVERQHNQPPVMVPCDRRDVERA